MDSPMVLPTTNWHCNILVVLLTVKIRALCLVFAPCRYKRLSRFAATDIVPKPFYQSSFSCCNIFTSVKIPLFTQIRNITTYITVLNLFPMIIIILPTFYFWIFILSIHVYTKACLLLVQIMCNFWNCRWNLRVTLVQLVP